MLVQMPHGECLLFLFTQYPYARSFGNLNFLSCKELISCNLGRYSDRDWPQHSFLQAMVIDSGMGTYFKLAAKVFPRTFFWGYQEKQNH